MFYGCRALRSFPDFSNWDTSKVINMSAMFQGCTSVTSLPDISKWDTSCVNNMSYMFYECKLLSDLPDISKWKTGEVKDMSYMFYSCSKLTVLPELSIWDISKLSKISFMFIGCSTSLNIPAFSKRIEEKKIEFNVKKDTNENKINIIGINDCKYYLSCYECKRVPNIIFKDNENIILTCDNCDICENEEIQNIVSNSSKWINKIIYYCPSHKNNEKKIAIKYCKSCDLLLCKSCISSHPKNEEHKLIDNIKNLDIDICEEHNKKISLFCKNCNSEICKLCEDNHKGHEIIFINQKNIGEDDIFNLNAFNNFLEGADKFNIFKRKMVEDAFREIKDIKSDDKLKLNKVISIINKLLQNDLEEKKKFIDLSKILYTSYKKIKENKESIFDNYKNVLNIIKKFFEPKEIKNLLDAISKEKNNYKIFTEKLTEKKKI